MKKVILFTVLVSCFYSSFALADPYEITDPENVVYVEAADPFEDLTDERHPNYQSSIYLRTYGIVEGYADGTFRPDNLINRAEFSKIVVGAVYDEAEISTCGLDDKAFNDTRSDQWYSPYICMAVKEGIVDGYSDGSFRPEANIQFAEAAKVLSLAYDLGVGPGAEVWYENYVRRLSELNAIPVNIKSFWDQISRGDMAELIYRVDHNEGAYTKSSHSYESLSSEFDWFEPRIWKGTVSYIDTKYYGDAKSYKKTNVTYDFVLEQDDQAYIHIIDLQGFGTEEKYMYENGILKSEYQAEFSYDEQYKLWENLAGSFQSDGSYSLPITPSYHFGDYVETKHYNADGTYSYSDNDEFVSFYGVSISGNYKCELGDHSDNLISHLGECLTLNTAMDGKLDFFFEDQKYSANPLKSGEQYYSKWNIKAQ